MMGLYNRYLLPTVLHLSCATPPIAKQRQKVVPKARGIVLEVGMGTGLNLAYYQPDQIDKVIGLEPAPEMMQRARRVAKGLAFDVEFVEATAEEMPIDDNSIDTIVLTFTLCTIPAPKAALLAMRRVLKPGGRLLFCEHGAAADPKVARCQDRLNGVWKMCAGGCNLNRDIPALLRDAGFTLTELHTLSLPSLPKIAGFNYWGEALIEQATNS
jgi:SAM-dependent methyltransferase